MKLDSKGFDLLVECEGLILHPYKDTKGVWTIGAGNTFYEGGVKVKGTDKPITKERAFELYLNIAKPFTDTVNAGLKVPVTQNQWNSLFIFCWNVGRTGYTNSTLLRLINSGITEKSKITNAFMMWKGKEKNKKGEFILQSRRQKEINNYFL
jgi:lysozyme